MKNQKGITLIALVITIIVLLILAGVTISLTVGKNGALSKARNAVSKNDIATAAEELNLSAADAQMTFMDAWSSNQGANALAYYGNATKGNPYAANCTRADAVGLFKVEKEAATDENRHVFIKYITKSQTVLYADMIITDDDSFVLSEDNVYTEDQLKNITSVADPEDTVKGYAYELAKGADLNPDEAVGPTNTNEV